MAVVKDATRLSENRFLRRVHDGGRKNRSGIRNNTVVNDFVVKVLEKHVYRERPVPSVPRFFRAQNANDYSIKSVTR